MLDLSMQNCLFVERDCERNGKFSRNRRFRSLKKWTFSHNAHFLHTIISFSNFVKSVYIKVAFAHDAVNLSYFTRLFRFQIRRTKPLGVEKMNIFDFFFWKYWKSKFKAFCAEPYRFLMKKNSYGQNIFFENQKSISFKNKSTHVTWEFNENKRSLR